MVPPRSMSDSLRDSSDVELQVKLSPHQPFQCRPVPDEEGGAAQLQHALLLQLTQSSSDCLPRGANQLRQFFVGQGNLQTDRAVGDLSVAGPLQQKPGQLLRNRMRQPNGADHLISGLALVTELLRHMQTRIGVLLNETEKVRAIDKRQLGGLQSLDRKF